MSDPILYTIEIRDEDGRVVQSRLAAYHLGHGPAFEKMAQEMAKEMARQTVFNLHIP